MRYPKALLIEVTNRCNADCVICGRSWWRDRPQFHMEFAFYQHMVDVLDCVDKVCLGQYGEPLLYPELAAAAAYAKRAGKYVWTTTNAQLLDEERATALLESGLDKLIFSVDHIDRESFERARVHLDWETVRTNIVRFGKLRDAGGYNTQTVLSVTLSPETEDSEATYRRFWDGMVDGVAFGNEVDVSVVTGTVSGDPIKCERPFDHITIRVDGAVVLCCRDCHTVCTFGNAHETDPLVIFNAPMFELTRVRMVEGRNYPAICKGCRGFWKDRRPPVRGFWKDRRP